MRTGLSLPGFAEEGFALRAVRELLGLLSQAFGFLGKALFEGLGLLESTTVLHDWSLVHTGPNRRVCKHNLAKSAQGRR
ncbi:hypothetical protein ABIB99_008801 [Bradyrhizobium sp. LA6.1]